MSVGLVVLASDLLETIELEPPPQRGVSATRDWMIEMFFGMIARLLAICGLCHRNSNELYEGELPVEACIHSYQACEPQYI